MKPVIVPFFISHQGCPHDCVFCDQRLISGESGKLPSPAEILETVDAWLGTSKVEPVQVAFYGGSFTMLPVELQRALLEPLKPLLQAGKVSSIRLSTRPDALDGATAAFLKGHGVSLVELGVQSMDDNVLCRTNRGHTVDDTRRAFQLLKTEGVMVGAQMMPGLPGESDEGALHSFRKVLSLRPDCIRIYPAVVLRGTELARMYQRDEYQPLLIEDAVSLCKVMLHEADLAGIPVIRVGLQPTDDLSSGSQVLAGAYHPALRQLVQNERWFDLLKIMVSQFSRGDRLTLHVSPSEVSDVIGQKRRNIVRVEECFDLKVQNVFPDSSSGAGRIFINSDKKEVHGDILRDLVYT